ncbi:chemotaxis protein CheV, partial [bacterium]|nr:chemotaxis protein CheV [bacterium]
MAEENKGILLESGTNEVEIAEFIVGNQNLGINVAKIQQIIQYKQELLTPLPESDPRVLGVFLFRGERTIPL